MSMRARARVRARMVRGAIAVVLFAVTSGLAATNLHATVQHAAPKWYVARVQGELYGPFRKQATAAAFCAGLTPAAGCVVEPVMPVSELKRKGAR